MVGSGLDGVVAADTELSEVDGTHGRLLVRGHWLESLVEHSDFEGVCHLLLYGDLPSAGEKAALRERLGAARARAFQRLPHLGAALHAADGMDALRGAVAQLQSIGKDREDAIGLIGALPVFAAAWHRYRDASAPIAPDALAGPAADYLRMLTGAAPNAAAARALDTYWCTVAEHGMNASTFAARVVASTGSDTVSAVAAALGALKGPLHGGAPGPVLDMLGRIGTPENAHDFLAAELAAGRRIMGMGHRVYRVRDPRAAMLEGAILRLSSDVGSELGRKLALARAVEQEAASLLAAKRPERALKANVEFFTAVLLDAVGIPRELFSATFAAARVVGWCAHVEEQRRTGRLIRPQSRYVGKRPVERDARGPVPHGS